MNFTEEDNFNLKDVVSPLKCRLNKDEDVVFEIDNEDADMFMDVINPRYVNKERQNKSKKL